METDTNQSRILIDSGRRDAAYMFLPGSIIYISAARNRMIDGATAKQRNFVSAGLENDEEWLPRVKAGNEFSEI